MAKPVAGAFVAFGITGDLAKEMTFRSLYRLERRGLLHCRIVGVAVDDWTIARLRRHMRDSIKARGEKLDRTVFDRLAARVSYIQGDFGDPATYERLAKRSRARAARSSISRRRRRSSARSSRALPTPG